MKINNKQIKTIFAIAKKLGISDGTHSDELHSLVFQLTKKESIASLTENEGEKVVKRLRQLSGQNNTYVKGRMTQAQKKKAWALIYRLIELDDKKTNTSASDRMAGAVKKILGLEKIASNPLVWVKYEDGQKLIEYLKRYVKSAEAKKRGRRL